jgi:cytidylate kinase
MSKNKTVIAIDGPSGAGKSTIAKALSEKLGIDYIDTGAMYRAIALQILSDNIDIKDDAMVEAMLSDVSVDQIEGRTILNGVDVSGKIRTPEVTQMASDSSALPKIREKLVALQRQMGERKSVVMDGRDIGSNVFPNADYKFYITASPEVRAKRRYDEFLAKGVSTSLDEVLKDIEERDYNDSHRALNPLKKTEDAIEIITDDLGINEVLEEVLSKMPTL